MSICGPVLEFTQYVRLKLAVLGRHADLVRHNLLRMIPQHRLVGIGYALCALLVPSALWGQGTAPSPTFSTPRGYYNESVELVLSVDMPQAVIRLSFDGSEPTPASAPYRTPIILDQTTVVRARVFAANAAPSPTATHTYFIGQPHSLPVVSLVSDPVNLWDSELGILAFGDNPGDYPYLEANFWEDREQPIHLEFFEADGNLGFHLDAGVKVHGGQGGRLMPQKSLAIFARKRYGTGRIDYPLFPDKDITKFESIVLRNSGNDWATSHFRDVLTTRLVQHTAVDFLAYRTVIGFINGEYWGIYNIREKINEHYLADNHGVDTESLDLLESNNVVIHGDNTHYTNLINFISEQDIRRDAVYEEVGRRMDVDNFIDYQVAEIFVGNIDWPAGNIKFWRPQTADGRWRWILFDTDFGYGLRGIAPFTHNSLQFATGAEGPEWAPPWSTFLVHRLLENDQFRTAFINRFADHLNSTFLPEKILDTIDQIEAVLEPEMPTFMARWDKTVAEWQQNVEALRSFARFRGDSIRQHILEGFGLEGLARFSLNVSPPGSGTVQVNSLSVKDFPWSASYFSGVPVRLEAAGRSGYRFSGWVGIDSDSAATVVELPADLSVTAHFTPFVSPVLINEINYHSADDFNPGDWVELHNRSGEPVDLSLWSFKDSDDDHVFTLPPDTRLSPYGYLVLCQNQIAFAAHFPAQAPCIGNFDFGLSNGGELVRLFNAHQALVDSLTYDDKAPWPPEADGDGPTLTLRAPTLSNDHPGNWSAAAVHGTPGASNELVSRADFDSDGPVDLSDFFLFADVFGQEAQRAGVRFDLDGSGRVDLSDFFLFAEVFGTISSAAVAE